ncbi:hypothetical protein, partial [Thalassolituus sp. UBA1965]
EAKPAAEEQSAEAEKKPTRRRRRAPSGRAPNDPRNAGTASNEGDEATSEKPKKQEVAEESQSGE